MRIVDTVEMETNIRFVLSGPGGVVQEQRTHNVWLDYGRAWLVKLMSYSLTGPLGLPPITMEDNRVAGMTLGIGGNEQNATIPAAVDADYPGWNAQTDQDVTITQLERPVTVSGLPDPPGPCVWLKEITYADTTLQLFAPYYVEYRCTFGPTDITYAPYYVVPLSEIGLLEYSRCGATYLNALYVDVYGTPPSNRPEILAYDTFPSLSKSAGVTLDVYWQIRLSS